jgi:hypothetical protein
MTDRYQAGVWNAACAICGFKFKSDKLKKNWKGMYVCEQDYETRQPLDFIQARTEKITPPWTRPEPATDSDIVVCYLWEDSSYADLAAADCSSADTTTYSYAFLLALKNGT